MGKGEGEPFSGQRAPEMWRRDREFLKDSAKWIAEHPDAVSNDDDDSSYDQPSSRD
jgi:hypothetical protein